MSRKIGFDYSSVSPETARVVQEHAASISAQLRHTSAAVLKIGQHLIDVHSVLGGSLFVDWVRVEFAWEKSTARRYMACSKRFGDIKGTENIQVWAMVLLSQRNTPQAAVDEALAISRSGLTVSKSMAMLIISRHSLKGTASVPFAASGRETLAEAQTEPATWFLVSKKRVFVSAVGKFREAISHLGAETMHENEKRTLASELLQLAEQIRNASILADDVEDVSEADSEDAETWLTEAPKAEPALV